MRLGTYAIALLPGVTSPSVCPAPLPGPGLCLATPLSFLAQELDWLYLLVHSWSEKGHAWGSSRPEADFRVGVKTAGCFP